MSSSQPSCAFASDRAPVALPVDPIPRAASTGSRHGTRRAHQLVALPIAALDAARATLGAVKRRVPSRTARVPPRRA